MIRLLGGSDSENPDKIYCYAVKRNSKQKDGILEERTPFNDNKTKIIRPSLYERLGDDNNLSFCYSINPIIIKAMKKLLQILLKNK